MDETVVTITGQDILDGIPGIELLHFAIVKLLTEGNSRHTISALTIQLSWEYDCLLKREAENSGQNSDNDECSI